MQDEQNIKLCDEHETSYGNIYTKIDCSRHQIKRKTDL